MKENRQLARALYAFMDQLGSELNIANGYMDMVTSEEAGPLNRDQQQYVDKVEGSLKNLIEFRERGMILLGMWLERDSQEGQLSEPFSRVISMLSSRFYRESKATGVRVRLHSSEDAGAVYVFSGLVSRLLESFVLDGIGSCQEGDSILIDAGLNESNLRIDIDFIGRAFTMSDKILFDNSESMMDKSPFVLSYLCAKNILGSLGGTCINEQVNNGIRFKIIVPESKTNKKEDW